MVKQINKELENNLVKVVLTNKLLQNNLVCMKLFLLSAISNLTSFYLYRLLFKSTVQKWTLYALLPEPTAIIIKIIIFIRKFLQSLKVKNKNNSDKNLVLINDLMLKFLF